MGAALRAPYAGTMPPTLRLALGLLWPFVLAPFAVATRIPALVGLGDVSLRWGAGVQRFWGRTTLGLLGVRIERTEDPPHGSFLIAANHSSYLDILVLSAVFPGRFVAKSEIAGWPMLGWMSRTVGTLFVHQARRRDVVRVGAEMTRTLAAGVSVVLFPEGRATRGDRLERFHTSLFEPAAREGIPCLPVVLHYETPGSSAGTAWTVAWWGGMDMPRHVRRLAALPGGVRARVRWAQRPLHDADRKALATRVRASMQNLYEPLTQEPVPADLPWPALAPATGAADPTHEGVEADPVAPGGRERGRI